MESEELQVVSGTVIACVLFDIADPTDLSKDLVVMTGDRAFIYRSRDKSGALDVANTQLLALRFYDPLLGLDGMTVRGTEHGCFVLNHAMFARAIPPDRALNPGDCKCPCSTSAS